MASGKSEEELMEEIAQKIAQNQISFDTKSDEEKRELMPKIDLVASSQLLEVQKKFNNIVGSLDLNVSTNVRTLILEGISEKVSNEGIKTIESLFDSAEIINYAQSIILEEEKRNSEEKEDQNSSILMNYFDDGNIEDDLNKIENELIERHNGNYTPVTEIEAGQENIKETFAKLDEDEMEEIIKVANSGDKKAQAVVMAIMTSLSFTKSTRKFDELTNIDDRQQALRGISILVKLSDEFGNDQTYKTALSVVKQLGLEGILEQDSSGNYVIDSSRLDNLLEENGIDPHTITVKDWMKTTESYVDLNGFKDMQSESSIENAQRDMRYNIQAFADELRTGKRTLEELKPIIIDMLAVDVDAANRIANELLQRGQQTPEIQELYDFVIKATLEKFIEERENGFTVDEHVEKTIDNVMMCSMNLMNEQGRTDKELMDLFIQINPMKTQMFYQEAKETMQVDIKEPEHKENGMPQDRWITEDEKCENLTRTLTERSKVKGVDDTLQYTTHVIDNTDIPQVRINFMNATLRLLENVEINYEEGERAARKGFFEKLIHKKVYDEDALIKMIGIDSTTMKEVLDGLIEKQNSRQENQLGAIMDLSSKMKEVSTSKVISADKVDVRNVVESVVGENKDVFESSKLTHEDDELSER